MVGGDGVSYGAPPGRRNLAGVIMLRELGAAIEPDRVSFSGANADDSGYLRLLQRSDAHVYFSLSVRGLVVVARGARRRVRGDRQRYGTGA